MSLATGTTEVEMLFSSHHKQINIDPWTKAQAKPNLDSVALDRSPRVSQSAKRCLSLPLTLSFSHSVIVLKECERVGAAC